MRKLFFALAVLGPMAASAQSFNVDSMQQGLNMLELNVAQILRQYDIDVDPRSLDLSQIVEIIAIVNDDDTGNERSAIEVAITRE